MSRMAKAKAARLNDKKARNAPVLSPQAAQEAMALIHIKEWWKANPARPMYAHLDEQVQKLRHLIAVVAFMHYRATA